MMDYQDHEEERRSVGQEHKIAKSRHRPFALFYRSPDRGLEEIESWGMTIKNNCRIIVKVVFWFQVIGIPLRSIFTCCSVGCISMLWSWGSELPIAYYFHTYVLSSITHSLQYNHYLLFHRFNNSYYFWFTMMSYFIIHPLPYHRLPLFLDG